MEALPLTGIASIAMPLICIIVTLCINWKHIWRDDLGHTPRKANRAEGAQS